MEPTKFIWDTHDLVEPMSILINQRMCVKKCVLECVLLPFFLYIFITVAFFFEGIATFFWLPKKSLF